MWRGERNSKLLSKGKFKNITLSRQGKVMDAVGSKDRKREDEEINGE